MGRCAGAVALAAMTVLGACGGGSGRATDDGSVAGTTARAATTALPAPPTTVKQIPQLTPDVAAVALMKAWNAGDRAEAGKVATAAAIATLFANPPQPFSDRGCQEPLAGVSSCAFGVGGGLVTLHTVTLAGGWLVDGVTLE